MMLIFSVVGENDIGIPPGWPDTVVTSDGPAPPGWIGPMTAQDFASYRAALRPAFDVAMVARARAEHVATLREQAWEGVDMREALACLAVVVGQLAAKLPEAEREAMAPALAYCDRVTTLLAGWADLEAAVGAATTYEQVQAVRPPLPDLTPPRAADLARAVRGRNQGE